MDAWRLVMKDLYHFVFFEWFGWRPSVALPITAAAVSYQELKPVPFTPRPLVKQSDIPPTLIAPTGPFAYVAVSEANLFVSPAVTFDGVIVKVPYGSSVSIFETQNRWFRVNYQGINGWMLRDDLVEELKEPQFKIGSYYDATVTETVMVRSELKDEFHGSLAGTPLTPEEFASYRLKRQGVSIPWGKERPRHSGIWQTLLKGRSGVHIGITPKTGSVMEWIEDAMVGHLAYVEAVYPDQSILISEIGWPEAGQYNERTLPKAEWIEWRPVFIEVS